MEDLCRLTSGVVDNEDGTFSAVVQFEGLTEEQAELSSEVMIDIIRMHLFNAGVKPVDPTLN